MSTQTIVLAERPMTPAERAGFDCNPADWPYEDVEFFVQTVAITVEGVTFNGQPVVDLDSVPVVRRRS